jgi:hypothetical protein
MNTIPDNLKRNGGRPFGDGLAPSTTAASRQIIAHRFNSFDILNECFSELTALAASVGIDWQLVLRKLSFNDYPIKNGIELTPKYRGKVYVRASQHPYKKHGQVVGYYPVITFKTVKHGGDTEVFKGKVAAHDYYERLQGNHSKRQYNHQTDWEAKRKTHDRLKQAEKKSAQDKAYKEKRFNDFDQLFKTLPREVGNHAYLVKKFGHLAAQAALSIELRQGQNERGHFIAYAIYEQSMRVGGYQLLYNKPFKDKKGSTRDRDFIFLPDSYNGAFALVGDRKDIKGRVFVAEGLANAITYHLAEDKPCFVALAANNLKPVVSFAREHYSKNITMLADNDRKNLAVNGNTGIYKAIQAINYGQQNSEDYLMVAPCTDAVNWDLSDVLVSNNYNIAAVKAVVDNTENRYHPSRDPITSRLNCIELMPSKQREKALEILLGYAVDFAPMRPLKETISTIRTHLGDEWSAFIDSRVDWVNKLYNDKKEAVKPLFSFTDRLPVFFAQQNIAKINAQHMLNVGGFYIDNRGMAAGKTQLMAIIARQAKELGYDVGYIAHRISLIANSAKRLALENYEDLKPLDMPDIQSMAICVNSLAKRYFSEFFTGRYVVFIDEIKQVLEHIVNGTVDKTARDIVFNVLRLVIQNAHLVVAADADLDQPTLNYLKSCRPVTAQIKSDLSGKPPVVNKTIFYGSYDIIKAEAIASVMAGKQTLIQCDTREETEVLRELFIKFGVSADDILVVNKETKAEPNEALFLKDPDNYLAKYKPRVVITSPTISSGFSIEKNYFDAVYLLMTGVLTPTEIMQTSARYRPAKCVFIGFNSNNSQHDRATTEAQKILGDMLIKDRIRLSLNENDDFVIDADPSELDKKRYEVKTNQEKSRQDFANKTLLCFEAKGYTIEAFSPSKTEADTNYKQLSKEAKKTVKQKRIADIVGADAIDSDTAKQYKKNANKTTRKQKRELDRFLIAEALATNAPTIQDVEFCSHNGIKKLSRFEILQSDEKTCLDFDKHQYQTTIGHISIMTKATAQHDIFTMLFDTLGIDRQTGTGAFSHGQAVEALNKLQQQHNELAALGLGNFEKVQEKIAQRQVGYLLAKLGLSTNSKKIDGKRYYEVKADDWDCMIKYIQQRKAKNIHTLRLIEGSPVFYMRDLQTDEYVQDSRKQAF